MTSIFEKIAGRQDKTEEEILTSVYFNSNLSDLGSDLTVYLETPPEVEPDPIALISLVQKSFQTQIDSLKARIGDNNFSETESLATANQDDIKEFGHDIDSLKGKIDDLDDEIRSLKSRH